MAAFIVADKNSHPEQYVGLQRFDTNYCCVSCEIQLFPLGSWRLSQSTDDRRSACCGSVASTFRIGYPHLRGPSLKIHVSAQFPGAGRLSVILLPVLRIHWARDDTQHWSNSRFTTLFGSPKSCGGSFFALRRFLNTKLIGLGFATADTLFRSTFLNSPGHDTLLSVWKKMAARK